MRRTEVWVVALTALVAATACDTTHEVADAPSAVMLINGVENPYVSEGANLAANRIEELAVVGEFMNIRLASEMVSRYLEIYAPWEATITVATALSHVDYVIEQATRARLGADMMPCAQQEILRQARYVRSMIVQASTTGAPALTQYDVTPYTQGGWPWGGCPGPVQPQNVNVSIVNGRALVTWDYDASRGEEFLVWEISPAGQERVVFRLDRDDCGDSTANNCQFTTRLVTFATSASNVSVLVEACLGLNCARSTAAVAPPAPVTDIMFAPTNGLVLTWAHSEGSEWYEITRSGVTGTIRTTQPTYTDLTATTVGTTYTYVVRACNVAGCSIVYTEGYKVLAPVPLPFIEITIKVHQATIKVGSSSNATVAVTVFGTETFDPRTLDVSSVTLGDGTNDVGVIKKNNGTWDAQYTGGNGQKFGNMTYHFRESEMAARGDLAPGTKSLMLRGRNGSGQLFRGSDVVRVIQ